MTLELEQFHRRPAGVLKRDSWCKVCKSKKMKSYRVENYEDRLNAERKWKDDNREQVRAYDRDRSKGNPALSNAKNAKRRAAKLNQTPKWLNPSQLQEILSFYELAQELAWLSERPLHVDHIIPLRGKEVSGLHVPWNLQILPEPANCSKSNRL